MIETIIKIRIIVGIATLTTELVVMPLHITIFGCSAGRSFTVC